MSSKTDPVDGGKGVLPTKPKVEGDTDKVTAIIEGKPRGIPR